MTMNEEKKEKHNNSWFIPLLFLYPITMIGAYFIDWKTLFYISTIPILILVLFVLYINIKYNYWIFAILPVLTLVIVSEIGYLVTKSFVDGICMGLYFEVIICGIEYVIQNSRHNNRL